PMAGRCQDLTDLTVVQLVLERHDAPVDLGTRALITYLGMDGVSKIDGCRTSGKLNDLALGGKGIDFTRIEIELQRINKLAGIRDGKLPFDQPPQPFECLVFAGVASFALLIFPVGCDAFLGDAMHLFSPNLDLERLPLLTDH